MKKSSARIPSACDRRNSLQVGPDLRGAGPRPFPRSNVRIVVAETRMPSLASSPLILTEPHLGFSLPIRRISSRTSPVTGGLPPTGLRLKVHFLCTRSRCQRRSVCGQTRNDDHRSRGRALLIAAMNKPSWRRRRGLPTWRLRTISWWRRTTTSTSVFVWSLEERAINLTTRRSNRYTRAKSTIRTSHERKARWYGRPGRGNDQGFVCPSGSTPRK